MAVRIKSKRQVEALCQLAKDAIYRDNETPTLYLRVRETGSAQWTQIVHIEGKRVERGLGGWPVVTIDEAREVALGNRRALRRGENPFAQRDQARREVAAELSKAPTFAEALEAVIKIQSGAWKSPKSEAQWRASMRDYAMPTLGRKRVDAIEAPDVLACLEPIWHQKQETANRVKQRISVVMDWAIGKQYRKYNPVAGIDQLLPKAARKVTMHLKALPFAEVPDAIATVRTTNAHTATKMAFEFLALTAARSKEVREATWDEIDTDKHLWEVPAERMGKTGKPHTVPLSKPARRILKAAARRYGSDGLIFPSPTGKVLSDSTISKLLRENGINAVPHGFRSSLRDWAGEQGWQRDIAEAALSHTIPNQTEAAYHRTRYLEKRREMMAKWAEFCLPKG